MNARVTRSKARAASAPPYEARPEATTTPITSSPVIYRSKKSSKATVQYLSATQLSTEVQQLSKQDANLLYLKQSKLKQFDAQVPTFIRECLASSKIVKTLHAEAAAATLTFAWENAGTAICISPTGLLLTCSHCVASSRKELKSTKEQWLLFASGSPVRAKCVAWDQQRDLALLQVVVTSTESDATTSHLSSSQPRSFPFVQLAASPPKSRAKLFCIGHPGSEDFEAEQPGVATGYDVLHISEGAFRGYAPDQAVQDNSEIGALMHDCWTYWGHSGAPLVEQASGRLIGLHSSWDDQTGMRRGIGYEAVVAFLEEHTTRDNHWFADHSET